MTQKTRLLIVIAAIVLVVAILAVALARCSAQPVPATETPGAMIATTAPTDAATEEPGTPTATPGPTPTPTEGEKAAAAVGQEYIAYRPTQADCEQAVDDGEVEACVWLDSAQLITRPQWEKLLPGTSFYLLDLAGYDEVYGHDHRLRLAAAHSGHYYTAETFDRLLAANGITELPDENRELVAQAFALMTIPGYLGEEIVFTEWEDIEGQPGEYKHDYDHCLRAWTKLQGLEVGWCFVFGEGRLKIATGPVGIQYDIGDYVEVNPEQLSLPAQKDYRFTGG